MIKVFFEDVKQDLNGYYSDWEIETWKDYLEATGRNSAAFKEDVYYILKSNSNDTWLTDDYELETEDGSFISYKKLMNAVRKELKNQGYLK